MDVGLFMLMYATTHEMFNRYNPNTCLPRGNFIVHTRERRWLSCYILHTEMS